MPNVYAVVMAGGRGERFWPLSREATPKHLLTLLGKRSFLQETVDRVSPLVPAKNIFVITTEAQLPEVRKQLPQIPKQNLIAERIGVKVFGTVGVVIRLKRSGLISEVKSYLLQIRRAGGYIGDELLREALQRSGESP